MKRLDNLFNQSVQALPVILEELPELAERMVSDMVQWQAPHDQTHAFTRIWNAVMPKLDAVRKDNAYLADAIFFRLCENDQRQDPRDKINKPLAPDLLIK